MNTTSNQINKIVEAEMQGLYTVAKACILSGEVSDEEMKDFIKSAAHGLTLRIEELN